MNKPLTQAMFYVLLSLKKERHGYEVMQYAEWLTGGRVQVGPGTLYTLLARFEDAGHIKMVSDDHNKKTYLLTDLGEKLLNQEIARLEAMIKDAKSVEEGNEDEFQNRD